MLQRWLLSGHSSPGRHREKAHELVVRPLWRAARDLEDPGQLHTTMGDAPGEVNFW